MLDLYLGVLRYYSPTVFVLFTAFPELSIHIQVPSCWPQLLTHSGTPKQASRNSHPGLLAASSLCPGLGRIWWRLLKYKNPTEGADDAWGVRGWCGKNFPNFI